MLEEPGEVDGALGPGRERQVVQLGAVDRLIRGDAPPAATEPGARIRAVVLPGPGAIPPLVDRAGEQHPAGRVDPLGGHMSGVRAENEVFERPPLDPAGQEVAPVGEDQGEQQRQHCRLAGTVAQPDDRVDRVARGPRQVQGDVVEPVVGHAEPVDVKAAQPVHQPSSSSSKPRPPPGRRGSTSPSPEVPSRGEVASTWNTAVSASSAIPIRNLSFRV